MSRFQSILSSRQSINSVIETKMEVLANELGIETIAPVLGYGSQLEKILGILRTASSAVNKTKAAKLIGLDTAVLEVFRDYYGHTSFINKDGVLIEAKMMDIEVITDLLSFVFNQWDIPVDEDTFASFTVEAVTRTYEKAQASVEAQQKFENPRSSSSKKINPFA